MAGFSHWWQAARPRTWPAALAPVALGSALAGHAQRFNPAAAGWCAAFALLAQIAANFANDYFDYKKGADTPGRLGPVRAVAAGLIAPEAMWRAAWLALVLAAAAGSGLIFYGGWPTVVIGAVSLVAAVAYTGGPFPLAYHGLGEVCVLVFFGFMAVLGTYYVQAGWPAPESAWLVAAACGLLATNILLVNNLRDVDTDARAGKRTSVVRYGRRFALGLYRAGLAVAAIVPVLLAANGYGLRVLAALATIPPGALLARQLAARPAGDGPGFNRLLAQTAQLLAWWAALLSAGMALG